VSQEESATQGYKLVRASAFEIGLVKVERGVTAGVKTWWRSEFSEWPTLSHSKVQEAIRINEEMNRR
jgi:hypothetical protein